jgi:hypothetical protein
VTDHDNEKRRRALAVLVAVNDKYEAAEARYKELCQQRREAVVAAVKAGVSKAGVGRAANISAARVTVIVQTETGQR